MSLDPGLSADETAAVEEYLQCPLPPDLSSFLQQVLPLGDSFPEWRNLDAPELRGRIEWPFDGIAFDIEHNAFWWPAWGARPERLSDAIELAREKVSLTPRLIPIFAEPADAGNPVLSVYQTDIIYYGSDLRRYLAHEFGDMTHEDAIRTPQRRIRFWSDVIDGWL